MQVAILGCGQLARMLTLAGLPMGMTFSFLAEAGEDTAAVAGLGPIITLNDSLSADDLYAALGEPDVITVEREQCSVTPLQQLAHHCAVHPNPGAIYQCQNRWRQKQMLKECRVSHTPFQDVNSAADLESALSQFSFPLVIKHTEEGYDGKAQWRLYDTQDIDQFLLQAQFVAPDEESVRYVAEPMMNFQREVSFLAARSVAGDIRFYPTTENVHQSGVLLHSVAPAQELSEQIIEEARSGLARIMQHLDYVGMMAMECFITADQWWVNELAPRVHNSGHWTMQSGLSSQFQNHLRAIADWPLGTTYLHGAAGMLNLLGIDLDQKFLLSDDVTLDWYNKTVRPGRKVGHLVLQDVSTSHAQARLLELKDKIYGKA